MTRRNRCAAILLAARVRSPWFLAGAALALSTSHAEAQSDDAITKQARARFQEGVDHFDKGQYEAARAAFLQAYALKKHPAVLLNLAQSSLRSNHPLEAARYFQQYLREATNISAHQRTDAEQGLAESRTKLGRIEIVAPAGTEVMLGDERLGVAPFREAIDVDPGPKTLKSRASDGSSETVQVTTVAGQRSVARFGANTPPVAAAPVLPLTPPPAETPPPASPEPAKDSGVQKSDTNVFSPPKTMVPVFIGAGVAVLGAAGAVVALVMKQNAQENADKVETAIRTNGGGAGTCASTDPAVVRRFGNACRTLADNYDQVNADATAGNVAIGVGIAGAAFAVGWYLFAPKKEPSQAFVVPMVRPGLGGVSFEGRF